MSWHGKVVRAGQEAVRLSYFGFLTATYLWWAPLWLRLTVFAVVGLTMSYCIAHSGY